MEALVKGLEVIAGLAAFYSLLFAAVGGMVSANAGTYGMKNTRAENAANLLLTVFTIALVAFLITLWIQSSTR
ncbi:MAG: hypothetical protein A2172_03570 [Candidatus Woykebacteria bacterium RBG_13_40_15]|uniref:Uncharacterized protein n=1 Tax=Candidatus Woykebacteria bacterium RBG_13_40_15 TaxID=1802593 RepID=A0A1G1W5P1_9BACT|nr:MAG: hypothetical protein A2172_03570 [Candidatus Woykebacteria bacterium RBG_13_40_15]